MRRATLLFGFILCFVFYNSFSQCFDTPVIEAITNGDFEDGDQGFNTDYTSILNGANYTTWLAAANNPNQQYFAPQGTYLVYKQGTNANGTAYNYFNGDFDDDGAGLYDHTFGDSTGSYMHLDGLTSAPNTMWEQTVNVVGNQQYYFSAWIASLASSSPPQLVFEVRGNVTGVWEPLNATPFVPTGTRVWNQFFETWFSGSNTSATIRLRNNNNAPSGNDLALDDISFNNGCGAVATTSVPDLGPDLTFCREGNSITLNSNLTTSNSGPDRRFYWYEGTTDPQTTRVNGTNSDNTFTITTPGTYRVCVTEDGSCGTNSTIVVSDTLQISIPDQVLCDPPTVTLDVGAELNNSAINSISWSGGSGSGSATTYTVDAGGVHNLNISSNPSYNCDVSESFNVDKQTPDDPGTNEYCNGGGSPATLTVDGSTSYSWYEDASATTPLSNSNSPGVNVTWNVPGGTNGDQTFYVVNAVTNAVGTSGPTSSNSYASSGNKYTDFTVSSTISLASVSVASPNGQCPGGNITLRLTNTDNNTFEDISTPAPACNGTPRALAINKVLTPGNYRLAITSGGQFNKSSPDYIATPTLYSLPGYFAITGYGNNNSEGFLFNWVIEESSACAPVPIVVTGNTCCTQNTPTLTVSAGTNDNCVGDAFTLTASEPGTTSPVYKWYKDGVAISNTGATLVVSSAVAGDAGSYTVSIESSASCAGESSQSTAQVITVNALPTVNASSSATGDEICIGESVNLIASGANSYSWNNGGGTGTPSSVSPTSNTTYTVTGTDGNNCQNTDQVTITVNALPTVSASSSATGDEICTGESVNLIASGANTYTWNNGGGTGTPSAVSPTTNTTYTVTGTDGNGCQNTDQVTITVNALPTVTASSSATNDEICSGDAVNLIASGANTYTWNNGGGTGTPSSVSPTTNTTYTVTGTDGNGCENTDQVTITVNTAPTFTASNPAAQCGGTVNLNDGISALTPGGATVTFYDQLTGGSTVSSPVSASTTVYAEATANGCTTSPREEIVVTIDVPFTITAATPAAECAPNTVDITSTVSPTGASLTYYDQTGGAGSVVGNETAVTATGTYSVVGVDGICTETEDISVTINALPTITSYTGGGDLCKEATSATLDLALTGAAPFTINYEVDGNPEAPLTGEPASASISPVVAAAIVPGVYEVTSITDANNCTANITGQTQTVAVIPDVSVTVSDASCDFISRDATVTFTVTGGDGAYSAGSTQTPVAGSFATDTYTATFAAIGSTAYDYTFSDGSGCADNTNQTGIANTINCDCPVQAEIRLATGSPSAICADGSITTLEVEVSGSVQATPNYTFTITYPTGTLSETDAVSVAGDVYTFEVSAEGPYTISTVADQQCTGSGTGSVDVTVNPLPVATFDPTSQAICDDNTATASVLLDVTVGTAPLQYDIDGPEASGGLVALQSHTPMTDGIYSLLQLRDANGCDMATPADAGTFEVTYIEDPQITNVTTMCSSNNPNPSDPGPFYYYLTVEAQDGDQASYNVELTLDDNSTIANAAGTWVAGVWTMDNEDAIDENRTVTSITLRDVNDCNTFTYSTATGQVCSCAETVDLSLTGSDSVCVLGTPTTSSLDLTFNDGGTGATSWNFQLLDQDDQVIEDFSGTPFIGTTHSVSNLPAGTYRVEGFQGNCAGKATSDLTIYEYASPAASITGTTSICDDALTTAQIDITPTAGVGPFTVSYAVDGGTAQANGTALTYQSNEFGVHTIAAITDANGCDADPADLTGSATLSGVTPPVAQIQSWNDGDVSTINNVPATYSAVAAGAGYNGAWTASDPSKGTNAGDDFTVTSALDYDQSVDLTWTLSDDGNLCPASTSTITVERRNITGAGPIPEDTICGPQAYTFTPGSLPNTGLGEDGEWTADAGSPAVTFNPTTYELSTTFAAPGDYTFTYRIYNPNILDASNNPIESQATLTVRVDNVVVTPTAGTDAVVCSEPYTLSGSALNADESGLWTAAGLTFTDETSNASGVSGLTEGVPTTLTWTVSSKYEECASESATVELTKAQDLTDATITPNDADSTYCISGANQGTPVLTTLAVNPANGETGTWSSPDVTINAGDLNTNSLDLTSYNLTSGQYSLTWTVSSSNCSDTKVDDIVITITDVPDVSAASLTFDDGCEGTTVNGVAVTGVTNADSYSWTAVSGGQVGTSSTSTTTFILETGGATSAEVSVVPSNDLCGSGTAVTATNTILLTPKDFPVITPAGGSFAVCQTKSDDYSASSSDADEYEWKWNTVDQLGRVPTTSTLTLNSADLAGLTQGTIEVVAFNGCGEGVSTSEVVTIITPDQIDVDLVSDKTDDKFCEETDGIVFTASSVAGTLNGLTPEYTFSVSGLGEVQARSTSNTYSAAQGSLSDGSIVTVQITGDVAGCYTNNTNTTTVTMDGYNEPNATLTASAEEICETDGSITLQVTGLQKGDALMSWSREGSVIPSETELTYTANNSSDRGTYEVLVENEVCTATSTPSTTIMIYEQPSIDPFLFVLNGRYVDYINGQDGTVSKTLPVTVSGLNEDLGNEMYAWTTTSSVLDVDPSSDDFSFTATGETNGDEYVSLTVTNGGTIAQCIATSGFNAAVSLPLSVPNAFSPNGDDINDVFTIQGMNQFPNAQMTIFNRWGSKIYERFGGYPADKAWDGEGYPVGTYYYILRLNDDALQALGKDDELRGSITITK